MATTQPSKAPAQRTPSGKDILSRMLQMEKQSRHQRAASTNPILPPPPKLDHSSNVKPKSSSPASAKSLGAVPRSPLRLPQAPHPQHPSASKPTMEKPEKPHLGEKTVPLTIDTDIEPEEKPAEICLSPSWSDHGEKARKKEKRKMDKEQKEREKKIRQEEERKNAIDLKTGKRLNKKPPPAAMETQKMPTAIRRDSWASMLSTKSSSGETSRRSSRDEKRSSGMSFGSFKSKRSHSTPRVGTETFATTTGASEPLQTNFNLSAPKLPSFKWSSSRRYSPDRIKCSSSSSDDSYHKDFIAFAYQLEGSEIMAESEKNDTEKQHEFGKLAASKPVLNHSTTEPIFKSIPYNSVPNKSPQRSPKSKALKPDGQMAKAPDMSHSAPLSPNLYFNKELPSPPTVFSSPTKASHDGSSYVHKQRMYQQQQFLAGFEDQQAIKDATEAACELAADHETAVEPRPEVPTKRDDVTSPKSKIQPSQSSRPTKGHSQNTRNSPIYTRQRDRSASPDKEPVTSNDRPPRSHHDKQEQNDQKTQPEALSSRPEEKVTLQNPQKPINPKSDKILKFRRRSKQPPELVSIPYGAEKQVVAVQPASLDGPKHEESKAKQSKVERFFKEPRPAFAQKERRSSSSSSPDRVKSEVPEAQPARSHSRTRTASSTLLNEDLASPTSTSKPGSSPTRENIAKDAKNGRDRQNTGKATSKTNLGVSHARQTSTNPETNVRSKPDTRPTSLKNNSASAASPHKDNSKSTDDKKKAHEVVVEGETGDGLLRKTSITRPRSNPQLNTQAAANNILPTSDFLPPLKHQPLVKRERQSPTRSTPTDSSPIKISHSQEPIAALNYESPNPPDLKLIPRSPFRPPSQSPVVAGNRFNRSSTEVGTESFGKGALAEGVEAKPIAKLFVICCKCKFWHDLPSKLYEAMALPLELHKADKGKVAGARLETAVKCPWCEHGMTTRCCQGWTTVVYMHERHH